MKAPKFVHGLLCAAALGLVFSQAALAQSLRDLDSPSGILDPNPDEFYCQVISEAPGCGESEACETAVCDIDSFCCSVAWDQYCVAEAQGFSECLREGADPEPIANFDVDKFFPDDGNPGDVEVTITCNTGLPLEQSAMISQGDGVVFVVRDFEDGAMDCEVTEVVPAGYSSEYFSGPFFVGTEGCSFTGVGHGLNYECAVFNRLNPVQVVVTKEWIDANPQFNPVNIAEATYDCVNEEVEDSFGNLKFFSNGDTDSFVVYPSWDGTTECTVSESVFEGGVEADDSDCDGLSVTLGNGAECTIVNTRLYEGIPTLSQYGLALLALLMLGVGFVAFRRMA